MKIDATRYAMFWANPERYRLRELWKVSPVEPKPDTFGYLLQFGRRRGSCFHDLVDAHHRNVSEAEAIQSLKDGGYQPKEISVATDMARVAIERDKNIEILVHEVLFEAAIPDSPHVLTGRIDRVIREDGEVLIEDFKTSGKCTKKERAKKIEAYKGSPQVPFYLIGARALGDGWQPRRFRYCLVSQLKHGVEIQPAETSRTSIELKAFQRAVHQTCELIEFMKVTFGVERPWPQLYEPFDRGYSSIMGSRMYEDVIPEGFVPAVEFLESMDDYEPEEADAA